MTKHDRYNHSEKGRARYRRNNANRIMVLGERIRASSTETRELMRQLRDERKASSNAN